MPLPDPRPFPPEFVQQDYPKIIYKNEQSPVPFAPGEKLNDTEFDIANTPEEEKALRKPSDDNNWKK